MRQLIAGNWKMNGLSPALGEIEAVHASLSKSAVQADVLICPPATLIARAVEIAGSVFAIGGQDCHEKDEGPFTGDISARMIADAGGRAVIVGHSERRRLHGETSAEIAAKAGAAHRAGLMAIVCIGETLEERAKGAAQAVCNRQIEESVPASATASNTAIAYEPIWAIGTGKTPGAREIAEMHAEIRSCLAKCRRTMESGAIRVLYGGSVNPRNARVILTIDTVDGALVGGASLKASDFLAILAAAPVRA